MKNKEKIIVICYDEERIWYDREEAKEFYLEAMMSTEGSQSERYKNIYYDLINGFSICRD